MAVIPHWTNKNLRVLCVQDNNKILLDVMSADVAAVGQEVADGIAGELRTRNQFILDHYTLKLETQQQKFEALKMALKWQDNIDAFAAPLKMTLGLVLTFNDGTRDTAVAQDLTLDAWSMSMAGRTDRNKFTIPFRCNIFKIL